MSDIFIEQLVKRQKSKDDNMKTIAVYALVAILAVVSLVFFIALFPVVLFAGLFLAYYYGSLKNIEYEYSFTNTEFDVDCIYNRQKRKRLYSLDLKNSTVIYKSTNDEYKNKYSNLKTIDLSSGTNNDTYCIIYSLDKNEIKFIIEPNESMIDAFELKLGRRIFIKN